MDNLNRSPLSYLGTVKLDRCPVCRAACILAVCGIIGLCLLTPAGSELASAVRVWLENLPF